LRGSPRWKKKFRLGHNEAKRNRSASARASTTLTENQDVCSAWSIRYGYCRRFNAGRRTGSRPEERNAEERCCIVYETRPFQHAFGDQIAEHHRKTRGGVLLAKAFSSTAWISPHHDDAMHDTTTDGLGIGFHGRWPSNNVGSKPCSRSTLRAFHARLFDDYNRAIQSLSYDLQRYDPPEQGGTKAAGLMQSKPFKENPPRPCSAVAISQFAVGSHFASNIGIPLENPVPSQQSSQSTNRPSEFSSDRFQGTKSEDNHDVAFLFGSNPFPVGWFSYPVLDSCKL